MTATTTENGIRPGIYNMDYFSGSQVACYIGDIFVDEITSLSFAVSQARKPLYGYADQYFRDVSKGHVLVQGQFTINFKEAGYMWLILERYQQLNKRKNSLLGSRISPFVSSDAVSRDNIERVINNEISAAERNTIMQAIAAANADARQGEEGAAENARFLTEGFLDSTGPTAFSDLSGFSSEQRAAGQIGRTENLLEQFEDAIWRRDPQDLDNDNRRADDPNLNPFDIYIAYGDFAGDNRVNHTIQKLTGVHIVGSSKQIVIDGQPIQEAYTFFARNQI